MTAHFLKARLLLNDFFFFFSFNSGSMCQWKQSGIFHDQSMPLANESIKQSSIFFQLQINECFSKGFIRVKVKF